MSLLAWFSSFAMSHSKIPLFYVQTHMRAPTHTYIHILSQTHTRTYANGTVIKNETTGFFENSQDWGKSQRRSGEKSPPGNNEENDHLLFLKTRWGFTEVKLPFDVFLTRFSSVEGLVSLSHTHTHTNTNAHIGARTHTPAHTGS